MGTFRKEFVFRSEVFVVVFFNNEHAAHKGSKVKAHFIRQQVLHFLLEKKTPKIRTLDYRQAMKNCLKVAIQ